MNIAFTPNKNIIPLLDSDTYYESITDDNRLRAMEFCDKGQKYFQNGKFQNAISYFEKALEYDLLSYEAFECLGRTYAKLNNKEMALMYIDYLVLYHGAYAATYLAIARIYLVLGKRFKSVFYAHKASTKIMDWDLNKAEIYTLMEQAKKKNYFLLPWELDFKEQFKQWKPSKHSRPDRVMNPLYNPVTNAISLAIGAILILFGLGVLVFFPSVAKEAVIMILLGSASFIFDKFL